MYHPSVLSSLIVFTLFYIGIPFGLVWLFRKPIVHIYHKRKIAYLLLRSRQNPIVSPTQKFDWETQGTFNPAAIQDDNGRVHILYRAIGSDGISRIGYDSSPDGIHFDDRLSYPVFTMQSPRSHNRPTEQKRNFVLYPSGGSWGGRKRVPAMVAMRGSWR